jgi:hypothetical protein
MGLLLACCQDCIGAVSIYALLLLKTHEPLPLLLPALTTVAPDYHSACSHKLFGKPTPLAFPYSATQLLALAEQIVRSHITVKGMQPKLSLTLAATGDPGQPTRFTIVAPWEPTFSSPQPRTTSACQK